MIRTAVILLSTLAIPARAEVPTVATDIAPVHGLAAMVMDGLGTPGMVLPQGASPHDHALRPSEARLLQDADLVFWIGPALTPGLARSLESLASDAEVVALMNAPGTLLLDRREVSVFAAQEEANGHKDGHGHGHEDEHAHADEHSHADEHGHADEQAHKDEHGYADDHDHGHGHDHAEGGADPHVWLDPDNARLWLTEIAEHLAEHDPENAATYRANADRAQARIAEASERAAARLAPVSDRPHVAFHDAYRYFEEAFGLNALGSIAITDATAPSPARLDALRDALTGTEVACFVAEPQYTPGLIRAVSEGTDRPVIVADPMGAELPPGVDFYPALIADLAERFATCGAGG